MLVAILGSMVLLPVGAVLGRELFGLTLTTANLFTQYLNLWLTMLGAVVAARASRHLNLSTGELMKLSPKAERWIRSGTTAVAVAVTAMLALASWKFLMAELRTGGEMAGHIPKWALQGAMPVGFAGMALYMTWVENDSWKGRLLAVAVTLLALSIAFVPVGSRTPVVWAGSITLLGAVALGAPIFTIMGGLAMLLLYGQPIPSPIAAVPLETFGLVASATLPAIPLFTLAGYLLAEGGASKRLVGLFQAWCGWLPGGIAAAAVLVCAFFTTFTGASGVTILALGGLLLPILTKAGYSEKFAIGVLIASGSIGLLFPPSLPVILYGVVSHVPINALFLSGVLPGILLVTLVISMGVVHAYKNNVERTPFELRPAMTALWETKWEAALPVLVLYGIFGGILTIFEAAAFTAAYAFFSEVVIHRDLSLRKDVPRVFVECGTLMGGVLIILGVALGFTNFLIDAEIPMRAAAWTSEHVGGKIAFLMLLNVFLLIVGCLMDIFSAIVVVVPLIVPIATSFGVDPVHLGILFLANLELGYLTPPVGMNLFLASYRFDKPLVQIYRMGFPFLLILLVGVLLITYVPSLTLWPHDGPTTMDIDMGGLEDESGEGAPPALPLGMLDLDALLGGDDDDATPTTDPVLPLGKLDLDALLNDDDDSGGER
jgi:tripartite ATP-independent transporter DctM subunit